MVKDFINTYVSVTGYFYNNGPPYFHSISQRLFQSTEWWSKYRTVLTIQNGLLWHSHSSTFIKFNKLLFCLCVPPTQTDQCFYNRPSSPYLKIRTTSQLNISTVCPLNPPVYPVFKTISYLISSTSTLRSSNRIFLVSYYDLFYYYSSKQTQTSPSVYELLRLLILIRYF